MQGLPVVEGQWGFSQKKKRSMLVSVTEKGGTNSRTFSQFVEHVASLYPDLEDRPSKRICIKTDMGPGRFQLKMLFVWRKRGVCVLPSLPNGTIVNAEPDRLFGPFEVRLFSSSIYQSNVYKCIYNIQIFNCRVFLFLFLFRSFRNVCVYCQKSFVGKSFVVAPFSLL